MARATEVERLLVDPRTSFVVVSARSRRRPPTRPRFLVGRAAAGGRLHLGAMVLNRTLPAVAARSPAAAKSAAELAAAPASRRSSSERRRRAGVDPALTRGAVLAEVAERFHDIAVVASREAERRAELAALGALTVAERRRWTHDVNDLAGLLELGRSPAGR